jgi:hypothetical protein
MYGYMGVCMCLCVCMYVRMYGGGGVAFFDSPSSTTISFSDTFYFSSSGIICSHYFVVLAWVQHIHHTSVYVFIRMSERGSALFRGRKLEDQCLVQSKVTAWNFPRVADLREATQFFHPGARSADKIQHFFPITPRRGQWTRRQNTPRAP